MYQAISRASRIIHRKFCSKSKTNNTNLIYKPITEFARFDSESNQLDNQIKNPEKVGQSKDNPNGLIFNITKEESLTVLNDLVKDHLSSKRNLKKVRFGQRAFTKHFYHLHKYYEVTTKQLKQILRLLIKYNHLGFEIYSRLLNLFDEKLEEPELDFGDFDYMVKFLVKVNFVDADLESLRTNILRRIEQKYSDTMLMNNTVRWTKKQQISMKLRFIKNFCNASQIHSVEFYAQMYHDLLEEMCHEPDMIWLKDLAISFSQFRIRFYEIQFEQSKDPVLALPCKFFLLLYSFLHFDNH